MADFDFDSYPQTLHFDKSLQELTRRTSFMIVDPYKSTTAFEEVSCAPLPYLEGCYDQSLLESAPLNMQAAMSYGESDFLNSALLPTSMNPPASLPPSVFLAPPPTSAYARPALTCPAGPFDNPVCRPCVRPVPVQMPELGYESASPASEGAPYPRMVLSESPLPKVEDYDHQSPVEHAIGAEEDSENADPCYAELLRKCLLEAPDHTMSLRDLYAWVAEHSPKAKDPDSTGWKNSVRHNLSMNQGFEKVPDKSPSSSARGSKTRSFWRLTDDAVLRGIQSTTRYRKGDGKRRSQRGNRLTTPDDKRVKSGAKGGQATRRLANRRAAAAARSTWSSARLRSHRTGPESSLAPAHPSPVTSLSSMIPFPEASPSYWASEATTQDPALYQAPHAAPPTFYKDETELQGYYRAEADDFYQHPMSWSQAASPMMPVKTEGVWLGDPQETGLSFIY